MKKALIPLATLILALIAAPAAAQGGLVKDEMGLTRMKAIYPEAGSETDSYAPMIAADFTGLETPADPETVRMLLDGVNVADSADVTVNYILYKPPKDLAAGKHEVRITALDEKGNEIEALAWVFYVKAPAPAVKKKKKEPDQTAGKLTVTTDYSRADYDNDPTYKVVDILEEKEGMKLNADLDFSNISGGRTVIGAYHRETQLFTDKEIDRVRMNYFDDEVEASLGHFRVDISDFTIAGAEMGGIKVDRAADLWSFSLFTGRTQDPSTSGSFKQVTTGARTSYHWNEKSVTSLTYLYAEEKDNEFYNRLPTVEDDPAKDRITSLQHEYKYSDRFSAEFEAAANTRRVGNAPADHDAAYRAEVNGTYKVLYTEAEVYSIGENFFPVAEGNAKYLKNNREGYRGLGRVRAAKWLSAGGEYEQYDSDDTDSVAGITTTDTTKRGNAFVAVSAGSAATLKYTHSKMKYTQSIMAVTTGVVSESDLVSAVFRIRKAGDLNNTVISASWQDVDYENSPMIVNTQSLGLSFGTRFGRRLGLSAGYTDTDTDSIFQKVLTENEKYYFGLEWRAVPDRLTLTGRYEVSDTAGRNEVTGSTTVDQDEWRLKTMLKYAGRENYTYLLGYDRISHDDAVNPGFSYDQNIFRSGVEMAF